MAATATVRSSAAARKPAPRRAAAPPSRAGAAPARRRRTGQTPIGGFVPVAAAAGAVGGIADSGLFVWLTRGRLWIGLLGALLVGIVGLNVMALSFSASSSNAGQAADALERQNSALRAQIAGRLSNSEIQDVAAKLGLVMPAAGSIGYLESAPGDASKAAQRLRDGELVAGVSAVAPPADAAVATAPVATVPVDTTAVDSGAAETVPVETAPPVDPAATTPVTEAPIAPVTETAGTASTAGAVGAP